MPVALNPVAPADAIAALLARGRRLDPTFAWQDRYAEDHAQAFTVAKSVGFDILADIHKALEEALREGKTYQQFAGELEPLLRAKGWWGRQTAVDPATGMPELVQLGSPRRLQLIFDVNMRVSYAAGQWANFQRNKRARPYLRYVHLVGQEHPRLHHQSLHNIVLPVDHPFWDVYFAPNGWNCHCMIQSLSQRDVDRLRAQGEVLRFDAPQIHTTPWRNKRTGETRHIPEGIDPGWDYNPGKSGHQSALSAAERLIDAPPSLSATLYDTPEWLARPVAAEFKAWFDLATAGGKVDQSTVVVGALRREVLEALQLQGREPMSGAITLRQADALHMVRDQKGDRAVPTSLLREVPGVIEHPTGVLLDKRTGDLVYVFEVPGDARVGKLVVFIDFKGKVAPPGGGRQTLTSNAIRTAGMVPLEALQNRGAYELIWGMV